MNPYKLIHDLAELERTWVRYSYSSDVIGKAETRLVLKGIREAIKIVRVHVGRKPTKYTHPMGGIR